MENFDELNNGFGNICLDKCESFLYSTLESTDFVTLDSRSDRGSVAVATKDVVVGTKIIREKPVLVFETGDWEGMFSAFMALDSETKDAVLNMYHPSIISPSISLQGHLIANGLSLDPMLVQKLLAIVKCNGQCYDRSDQDYDRGFRIALFLFGSKLVHSCNPNTVFTGVSSDGRMESMAVRPIQAGEVITFSFLGSSVITPTYIKQKELREMTGLLCSCPQCIGPDYTRAVHCKECEGGVLLCINAEGDNPIWSCSSCNGRAAARGHIETLENEIEKDIEVLEFLIMTNRSACFPKEVKAEIKDIASKLHPQHVHTLNCMRMYIELCCLYADDIEMLSILRLPSPIVARVHRNIGNPMELRMEATKMGVSLIEKIECIAACCVGSDSSRGHAIDGCTDHACAPYACSYAFIVAKNMMQCPSSVWPTRGRSIVHRYLTLMKHIYSEHQDVLADIEQKIPAPENDANEAQSTAPSTLRIPAEKKAKQRRKNKKKRGRKK